MRANGTGIPPGHRPFRPSPGPPICWPDAFGTRFTVFVDVEEEFDWRAPLDSAHRSTTAMTAFPYAHRWFAERGVGLTCMVDYPIASDPVAIAILGRVAEDDRCAIGTQLHPWVNPPLGEPVTPFSSYAGNLSRELEASKIAVITDTIERAFSTRPVAFRAGRYGLGPWTLRSLAAAGYRLDSSVRAGYDLRADGGPDFSRIGNAAYWSEGMVELPLTSVYPGRAGRRIGPALYRGLGQLPHARGAVARLGIVSRVALTPEGMPVADALRAVEAAVAGGERLLVFSFHSPSLAPGHTPYVRTAAELATFYDWWMQVLARLTRLGVDHASLADILAARG